MGLRESAALLAPRSLKDSSTQERLAREPGPAGGAGSHRAALARWGWHLATASRGQSADTRGQAQAQAQQVNQRLDRQSG